MRTGQSVVYREMQALFGSGALGALSDEQLLERFLGEQSQIAQVAFATLVERHGRMVLGVCRRILPNEHDAQDAFQATFLVLVRKASSVRVEGSLGRWLHGVGTRVAKRLRQTSARRRTHESTSHEADEPWYVEHRDARELRSVLDEELAGLPDPFREAIVVCYLEGLSHQEAARQLGWPVGTVRSRLARGKEQLRHRLIRRGVAVPSLAGLSSLLACESSQAAVPKSLITSIVNSVYESNSDQKLAASAGAVSAAVAALSEGVCKAMLLGKLKIAAAALLVLCGSAGSYALLVQDGPAKPGAPGAKASQVVRDEVLEVTVKPENVTSAGFVDFVTDNLKVEIKPESVTEIHYTSDVNPQDAQPKRIEVLNYRIELDQPPTLDDILAKAPQIKGMPIGSLAIRTEKIGDKTDECKVYPLAGPCQLVHKHYKATIRTDASAGKDHAVQESVVYIDKDHLVRCSDSAHKHQAAQAIYDVLTTAASGETNENQKVQFQLNKNPGFTNDQKVISSFVYDAKPRVIKSQQSRIEDVEKKLDDVLKALDELKKTIKN